MTAFFEKIQIKMCCEHWRCAVLAHAIHYLSNSDVQ